MKRAWALAAVAAVAVGLLALVIGRLDRSNRAIESSASVTSGDPAPPFAPSMRGTKPDGHLSLSAEGLHLNVELLYLFDYYLSAQGERTLQQVIEGIRAELRAQLRASPKAMAQAEDLLSRYIEYKKDLFVLERSESAANPSAPSTSTRLAHRLERLQVIRRQHFSPAEVDAFFTLDEQRDADTVARLRIAEDKGLDADERRERYAQLDAAMPRRLLEDRQAPLHVQTVEQAVSQMRAKGANEQEVYQFRAQQFSPDAAHRLQALEQEQLQWASRIAQYQAEVRLLLQLPDGPLEMPSKLSAAQQSAIEASRNRYFSAQEQRRLAAYEGRAVGSTNSR